MVIRKEGNARFDFIQEMKSSKLSGMKFTLHFQVNEVGSLMGP
jgi:hypothetical protein